MNLDEFIDRMNKVKSDIERDGAVIMERAAVSARAKKVHRLFTSTVRVIINQKRLPSLRRSPKRLTRSLSIRTGKSSENHKACRVIMWISPSPGGCGIT
jgi:hypothetical protein